jgi:LPXTG-site transpeptidase (sortase) family protein
VRGVQLSRVTWRGLLAVVLALLVLVGPGAPAGPTSTTSGPWSEIRTQEGSTGGAAVAGRDRLAGVPASLEIPRLGVDAEVAAIDADERGVLVPPGDPTLVGWWADGARPGSRTGAVLLTGHTVRGGGGVFDDLAELATGDLVEVGTRRGDLTYVVDTVQDLSKEQLAEASQELFATSGRHRVVLVTCTDWEAGRYLGNTVVVAVPAGSVGRSGHREP